MKEPDKRHIPPSERRGPAIQRLIKNGEQAAVHEHVASCAVADTTVSGDAVDDGLAYLLAMWEPLFSMFTPEQRAEVEAIERLERTGMFAWGVRSGYFLWVRLHPGEKPTMALLVLWKVVAQMRAAERWGEG